MNKEGLKEKINWYRHLFTFFSAVNFASAGWFVANYGKSAMGFLSINILLLIFSLAGMLFLGFKITKHIKKLGED